MYSQYTIPRSPGIYKITCVPTAKIYVGSANDLYDRWHTHLYCIRHNLNRNPKLQNAFNKYGEDAFIFEVLELVLLPEMLTAREQYWFDTLKPFGKNGFNIARNAKSRLGTKQPPEWIEKRRLARLGKKDSQETIRKRALSITGRYYSPETRKKIGLASLGRKHTPETRAKMSIAVKAGMMKRRRMLIVTSPEGIEYAVVGISQFCQEHQLQRSNLIRVAKGKQANHKGWIARYPDVNVS